MAGLCKIDRSNTILYWEIVTQECSMENQGVGDGSVTSSHTIPAHKTNHSSHCAFPLPVLPSHRLPVPLMASLPQSAKAKATQNPPCRSKCPSIMTVQSLDASTGHPVSGSTFL